MTYLGIDVGSKGVKIVIVEDDGNIVDSKSIDISDLIIRPKPAWAERDELLVWERIIPVIRKLRDINKVDAVCIDGTSGTIVPINQDLKPLTNALLYSDSRAVEEAEDLRKLSEKAREYEDFLPIAPYLVIPKILWLKKHLERFSDIYKIAHENDFFSMLLTDSIATSPNIAGKSHADILTGNYIREIYEDVGIDISLMPEIKPVGEVIGYVTSKASSLTNIPNGTPVINGVTDSSAGDVATGTLDVGIVNVNIGTTLVVHGVVDRVSPDPEKRIYYKSYFEKRYLVGGATNAGTIPFDALSKLLNTSLGELEKMASEVPPGSDGLIAQPQWIGTRIPESNPNMLGFFINITEKNFTPGHLYRSLLEGNAFVLNMLLKIIEDVTEVSFKEIRTIGGGARSKLLNKIIADVTGKEVKSIEGSEPATGSAIIAIWGMNKRMSILDIAMKFIKVSDVFSPSGRYEVYKENEEVLFKAMKALGEIF